MLTELQIYFTLLSAAAAAAGSALIYLMNHYDRSEWEFYAGSIVCFFVMVLYVSSVVLVVGNAL
jgi:uncharacterized membrane protein YcjF (UPF0283 family)